MNARLFRSAVECSVCAVLAAGGCGSPAPAGPPDMAMRKHFFTTQATYLGSFGGLSAADAKCTVVAQGALLSGTWVAWLSSRGVNAIDRVMNDVGPWYQISGARVFNNAANLTGVPLAPLNKDENGRPVTGLVWTGTQVGGTAFAGSNSNCADWKTGATTGAVGDSAGTGTWTFSSTDTCNSYRHLYCIEQ